MSQQNIPTLQSNMQNLNTCKAHQQQAIQYIFKSSTNKFGIACHKCLEQLKPIESVWSVRDVRAEVEKLITGKGLEEELNEGIGRLGEDLRLVLQGLVDGVKLGEERWEGIWGIQKGEVEKLARQKVRVDQMLREQCGQNRVRAQIGHTFQSILRMLKGLKQEMDTLFNKPASKGSESLSNSPQKNVDFISNNTIFDSAELTQSTLPLPFNHIEILKEKINTLKKLSQQSLKQQTDINYYKKICQQNYVRIAQLQQDLADSQKYSTQLEIEKHKACDHVNFLKEDINRIGQDLKAKQGRLGETLEELEEARESGERSRALNQQLERKFKEKTSEWQKTEEQLKTANHLLKQKLQRAEEQLKEVDSVLEIAMGQMSSKNNALDISEQTVKDLWCGVFNLENQQSQTTEQLQKNHKQTEEKYAEISISQKILDIENKLRAYLEMNKHSMLQMEKNSKVQIQSRQQNCQTMNMQIQRQNSRICELNQELDKTNMLLNSTQSKLTESRKKIKHLQAQMKKKSQAFEDLNKKEKIIRDLIQQQKSRISNESNQFLSSKKSLYGMDIRISSEFFQKIKKIVNL